MELNRNPENYFAEVEQSAFNPANIVPGIGFSPDKMLQGRLFSYGDAQCYRLGVNHQSIPVNAPRCPFHSFHRDGAMRVNGNYGGTLDYEPNSYGEWQEQPDFKEPPPEPGRRCRPLEPSGGRRLLLPARTSFPFDETGAAGCLICQYGKGDGRCASRSQNPAYKKLPEGRFCLRQGSSRCTRNSLERGEIAGGLWILLEDTSKNSKTRFVIANEVKQSRVFVRNNGGLPRRYASRKGIDTIFPCMRNNSICRDVVLVHKGEIV